MGKFHCRLLLYISFQFKQGNVDISPASYFGLSILYRIRTEIQGDIFHRDRRMKINQHIRIGTAHRRVALQGRILPVKTRWPRLGHPRQMWIKGTQLKRIVQRQVLVVHSRTPKWFGTPSTIFATSGRDGVWLLDLLVDTGEGDVVGRITEVTANSSDVAGVTRVAAVDGTIRNDRCGWEGRVVVAVAVVTFFQERVWRSATNVRN